MLALLLLYIPVGNFYKFRKMNTRIFWMYVKDTATNLSKNMYIKSSIINNRYHLFFFDIIGRLFGMAVLTFPNGPNSLQHQYGENMIMDLSDCICVFYMIETLLLFVLQSNQRNKLSRHTCQRRIKYYDVDVVVKSGKMTPQSQP